MTMVLLGLASLGLVSCGGGDTPIETPAEQHDSSAWFTEEELAKVGLSGLTCPTGCTGESLLASVGLMVVIPSAKFVRIKPLLKPTRKPIIPISPRTTLRSLGKKNSWLFPPITARLTIGLSLPR